MTPGGDAQQGALSLGRRSLVQEFATRMGKMKEQRPSGEGVLFPGKPEPARTPAPDLLLSEGILNFMCFPWYASGSLTYTWLLFVI